LLKESVALRPDWDFVVAGRLHRLSFPEELRRAPNLEFVERIEPAEVPAFLESIDAGLGLYKRGTGSDGDSMKFYEYLAAQVPVVTTPFHDYLCSDFDDLLQIAATGAEFVTAIERVLQRDEVAQRAWEDRCRAFIAGNTWVTRVHDFLEALDLRSHRNDSNTRPLALP